MFDNNTDEVPYEYQELEYIALEKFVSMENYKVEIF